MTMICLNNPATDMGLNGTKSFPLHLDKRIDHKERKGP